MPKTVVREVWIVFIVSGSFTFYIVEGEVLEGIWYSDGLAGSGLTFFWTRMDKIFCRGAQCVAIVGQSPFTRPSRHVPKEELLK